MLAMLTEAELASATPTAAGVPAAEQKAPADEGKAKPKAKAPAKASK